MEKAIINDAIALLEECLHNGDRGVMALYSWFMGERHLIETTIRDLNEDASPTNQSNGPDNACTIHEFVVDRTKFVCIKCGKEISRC